MSTRAASRVGRRASLDTRPHAPTNGYVASAKSRASSAATVLIVNSFQSPTTSSGGTCLATLPTASPSSRASIALLQDDTCHFLAVDFDKADWRQDAARAILTPVVVCACPRRSSVRARAAAGTSGSSSSEAIPASLARRLGAHVLTETLEARPDVGLDSYDRFFPNQDVLPQGGFGNLIALPLQKGPREKGNSVFLDDSFRTLSRSVVVSRERASDRPSARRADRAGRRATWPDHRRAAPTTRKTEMKSRGPLRHRDTARSRRSPANYLSEWS